MTLKLDHLDAEAGWAPCEFALIGTGRVSYRSQLSFSHFAAQAVSGGNGAPRLNGSFKPSREGKLFLGEITRFRFHDQPHPPERDERGTLPLLIAILFRLSRAAAFPTSPSTFQTCRLDDIPPKLNRLSFGTLKYVARSPRANQPAPIPLTFSYFCYPL